MFFKSRRCRKVQPNNTPYIVLPETIKNNSTILTAQLLNRNTDVNYILELTALKEHTFRLHINEEKPLRPRYEVTHALQGPPKHDKFDNVEVSSEQVVATMGKNKAIIHFNPFRVDLYANDKLKVSANARGLMRMEHLRTKTVKNTENKDEEVVDTSKPIGDGAEDDPGAWEENFKSHHDSKPKGPEAIAMDFSFPGADYTYGIPQHADSFALRSTKDTDPYRLYNLDVFEYEVNEKMALYGSIPVIYSHGKDKTSGVFWHNAAETWVDIISKDDNLGDVNAHFMSESGVIDIFFLLGDKPLDVFSEYTKLTGTAPLPQMFTLGYHQSRWNYNDQDDVAQISEKFDTYDIPLDVIWLDIEYTDNKKYFTWDTRKFSNPLEMVQNLTIKGRKLVAIIDPHIKRDSNYFVHNDATSNGYYVKHADGKDYEGWCWPGASSYLDFFNPIVRDYFEKQYSLDKFHGTTNDVYIWNDMNEPSVFNGPEITMPKDLVHYGGWEHRDVHNINGLMFTSVTYDALFNRSGGTLRPFVLTRSHFAGSQRSAAVWTGDNAAEWEHLKISYPMCLSTSIAGMSFCGADVGGFFKNPDSELFIRWNQAGAWLAFFRQHSHIETKRREPWTFNDETVQIVRDAIRTRYTYLPFWYTLFREHDITGYPVMRSLWTHYPDEIDTFTIDDHLLIGDAILVRPIYEPSVTSVSVYFPGNGQHSWYDIDTFAEHNIPGVQNIPVTLHKIPVYQRGGSIVPRKMRIRRSTVAMKDDPYTLIVIADKNGQASGTLYLDDESSFEYRHGKYVYVKFTFDGQNLTSTYVDKFANYETPCWLERVDIVNPPQDIISAKIDSSMY